MPLETSSVISQRKRDHILHPDEQPWKKCCGDSKDCICAYRRSTKKSPQLWMEKVYPVGTSRSGVSHCVTVCCHRTTEDGYLRYCAGWYALVGRHEKNT